MTQDPLIDFLVQENAPHKILPPPTKRFFYWLLAALFCVGTGIALFGLRVDFEQVIWEPNYALQAGFSLCLALCSALSAFALSVPDKKRAWTTALPALTLLLWAGTITASMFSPGSTHIGLGLTCIRDIVVLALLPGALLFLMLLKAAPLSKSKVGGMAALSVAALGAVGSQFICHNNSALHVLTWHYAPVLLIGATGFWLGRAFFR